MVDSRPDLMDTTALADNQAIDVAAWVSGQPGFTTTEVPLILAIVRAAFGRLRAVAGEPVLWVDPYSLKAADKCRGDDHNGYVQAWMRPDERRTTPFYTHPQPATPASGWMPIETMPADDSTFIVTNRLGEVCPMIRGVIQNNPGTNDWTWGEAVTGWQPLPATPNPEQPARAKGGE